MDTVYVTKYALTKGIIKKRGTIEGNHFFCDAIYESYFNPKSGLPEWCLDEKTAIETAEKMRDKKIASLNKSIKSLKEMTFKVIE